MQNQMSGLVSPAMGPSLPVVLDVEASGFGAGSYPIEVGIALPDGTTRCYLIRPAPDWTHWDAAAESVHRITRTILDSRGRPLREVAERLNGDLRGLTVYSDAWGYDRSWIARLFDAAEMPQHFRLESLRSLMTEAQIGCWDNARRAVQESLGVVRHRASADALVIQKTFQVSAEAAHPIGLTAR
jgi:hypothetical protein